MMQHWESGIMNVSVGDRWEKFVEQAVKAGRYGSASEVVREGLRLVEEREAKLRALRATLDASIAAGGPVTDDQLDAALARRSAELLRKGGGA
jgi:antitoxin ParD1/3/4